MDSFEFHSEPIQKLWLDAYGHLNEAYYLVPFTNATWKLQDHFGIGEEYFDQTTCALYTVETHLRYLHEVRYPATVNIKSFIVDSDTKRIWFAHQMFDGEHLCATAEFVGLHYNTDEQRTADMPLKTCEMLIAEAVKERPSWIGRQLGLSTRT